MTWARRSAITIDTDGIFAGSNDISGMFVRLTETNLPPEMLDRDGPNRCQLDGGDIRFTTDVAGTNVLGVDIVKLELDNNPANSRAEIYVGGVGLELDASANTTIYVWYDSPTTLSQPAPDEVGGRHNVYNDTVLGFWPMVVDGNDRTRSGNNLGSLCIDATGTLTANAPSYGGDGVNNGPDGRSDTFVGDLADRGIPFDELPTPVGGDARSFEMLFARPSNANNHMLLDVNRGSTALDGFGFRLLNGDVGPCTPNRSFFNGSDDGAAINTSDWYGVAFSAQGVGFIASSAPDPGISLFINATKRTGADVTTTGSDAEFDVQPDPTLPTTLGGYIDGAGFQPLADFGAIISHASPRPDDWFAFSYRMFTNPDTAYASAGTPVDLGPDEAAFGTDGIPDNHDPAPLGFIQDVSPAATGEAATSVGIRVTTGGVDRDFFADADGANTPVTVQGLRPGTTYTMVTLARNAAGTTVGTTTRTFTTTDVAGSGLRVRARR